LKGNIFFFFFSFSPRSVWPGIFFTSRFFLPAFSAPRCLFFSPCDGGDEKSGEEKEKNRSSRRENLNLVRIDANWSVVLVTSSSFSLSLLVSWLRGTCLALTPNRFAPFCDYSMLLWAAVTTFFRSFFTFNLDFFSLIFFSSSMN
jgi:hypothetical protein